MKEKKRAIAWEEFGQCVDNKIALTGLGYRECAQEMRLDFSTLYRISVGMPCRTDIYLTLCMSFNIDPFLFYRREGKIYPRIFKLLLSHGLSKTKATEMIRKARLGDQSALLCINTTRKSKCPAFAKSKQKKSSALLNHTVA